MAFAFALALAAVFPAARLSAQAKDDYRSAATGNWNATATWERFDGTAWVAAVATPTSANGVITIRSPHTVTVTAGVTIDQTTVDSGGQVTVNGGVTLNVANGSGNDLTVNGTLSVSGTVTLGSTATLVINGSMTIPSGGLLNGNGGSGATRPTTTVASGGTFTIDSGGSLSTGGSGPMIFTVALGGVATINGTISGVVDFTVAGTLTASNNISVAAIATLSITGTMTQTAGTLSASRGNGGSVGSVGSGGTLALTGSSVFSIGTVANASFSVASGGTLEMGPSAVVSGAGLLQVNSGANLKIGSADGITTGTATGNVRTNGTDSYNAGGNYTYDGTAAQVTGNALPASIAGLTINNSAGVTLSLAGNTTVTTALSLQSGVLNAGSNKVIIPSGSSVTATSGWVYATGAGGLQENVTTGSNVSRTFPVGTATASEPVSVTFASVTTAGDLIAKATSGDHGNIGTSTLNASQSVNLNWTLTNGASAVVFTTYSAVFNFSNPADLDTGTNTSYLLVGKFNSPNWTYPTVGTRTSASTQATGITSTFGDFQLAQSGVATKILVETAANGGGTVVPAQNVTAGSSLTVYAIGRDGNDNFVANVAADSWSLAGITGGVVAGDLVAAGDSKSAAFTGHHVGTAAVHAAKAGLASTDSGTLTVIAGAPSKLAFGTQPSNTVAGSSITPAVTVRILDANDNLTSSTASVTVAIGTNPGVGTLSGALTQPAVSGTATFNDLSINNGGAGYTLTAASTGLTGATSSTFDITVSGYWVNNLTGSDANAGTQAAPFATIGKAASVMGSGGTVHVEVGNSQSGSSYAANNVVTVAMAGTSGQQTLIQGVASGGALPLVTGTDPAGDVGFDVQGSYVTIDGFEIRNTLAGIYSEASNTGARISNNYVVSGHLAYGIILDTTSDAWVHDNRVEQTSGGASFFGIWDYTGNGNVIELNKVKGHGADGIVSHYSTGLTIRRNVLNNNPGGIHVSNATGPVTLYNNTVDGSAWLGIYAEQSPVTVTSRNNIVVDGGYGWGWDGIGTISSNYDDVYNNVSNYNYTLPVTPGANSISADPSFVQTNDPTAADYYQLSPGSPCINAGTDVGYGTNIGAVP